MHSYILSENMHHTCTYVLYGRHAHFNFQFLQYLMQFRGITNASLLQLQIDTSFQVKMKVDRFSSYRCFLSCREAMRKQAVLLIRLPPPFPASRVLLFSVEFQFQLSHVDDIYYLSGRRLCNSFLVTGETYLALGKV